MVARLTWRLLFATRDSVCELNVLGQTILAILAVIKNLHHLLLIFFHCVKTFKQIYLPDVCTTMKAFEKMLKTWHNDTKHFNRKQYVRIGETIFHLSLAKVVLIFDTSFGTPDSNLNGFEDVHLNQPLIGFFVSWILLKNDCFMFMRAKNQFFVYFLNEKQANK